MKKLLLAFCLMISTATLSIGLYPDDSATEVCPTQCFLSNGKCVSAVPGLSCDTDVELD